jgi:Family of unknown function (DUF6370)
MRVALSVGLGCVLALVIAARVSAEDKEVTLKGTITCAKCDLKLEKKCHTVIKVEEGGKDVVYYLDDESAKKNHKTICTEPKKGSVTGKVSEKDGKKIITASKVTFDE